MPVDPNADIEVVSLAAPPKFVWGYVRDFRVRWALEEAGLSYRTRLISAGEREEYFDEQPFGQVPAYREGDIAMFESGAIVMHIADKSDALMPRGAAARARAMSWAFAAMNSIEPVLMELLVIDLFAAGEEWTKLRRPGAVANVEKRLGQLEVALGDKHFLEDVFTAGDLLMASALRATDGRGVLEKFPKLAAYQGRCLARPAYSAAIAAQISDFEQSLADQGETV